MSKLWFFPASLLRGAVVNNGDEEEDGPVLPPSELISVPSCEWTGLLVRHVLHKDQGEFPRFQMESQVHGGASAGTCTGAAAGKSKLT